MIVIPITVILLRSFTETGIVALTGFTLRNYVGVLSDPELVPLIINSLEYSVGAAAIGTGWGAILAWIVARTNTPGKTLVWLLPIYPLLMPAMMKNIAWIFLLAPKSGVLNSILASTLGIQGLFTPFSMATMIWVFGIAEVPLAYLFFMPVFMSFDPSLEESAYVLGSNPLTTMLRITFPIAIPAFLSTLALNLIRAMKSFETPLIHGIPAGIHVFSTKVYDTIALNQSFGVGTAYCIVYVMFTLALVAIYVRATRYSERYATVTGKGYRVKAIDIGKWKYLTLFLIISFFILVMLLPLAVLIITSLMPYYSFENVLALPQIASLTSYTRILSYPDFIAGLYNSFWLAISAALFVTLVSTIVAFVMYRTKSFGGRIFEYIGMLPLTFPPLVLGVAILTILLPTFLYGTPWALEVAFCIAWFPYGLRNASTAIIAIHKELDEAVWVHGGKLWQGFLRVTLPLMKAAISGTMFYLSMAMIRDLGIAILFTAPGGQFGPVVLYDLYGRGAWSIVAAGGIIYLLIMAIILTVAKFVLKIDPLSTTAKT